MYHMGKMMREVWVCDVCGWAWIAESDGVPERCPSRKCRKKNWNLVGSTPPEEKRLYAELIADEESGVILPEDVYKPQPEKHPFALPTPPSFQIARSCKKCGKPLSSGMCINYGGRCVLAGATVERAR
jgi:hypothetical protein